MVIHLTWLELCIIRIYIGLNCLKSKIKIILFFSVSHFHSFIGLKTIIQFTIHNFSHISKQIECASWRYTRSYSHNIKSSLRVTGFSYLLLSVFYWMFIFPFISYYFIFKFLICSHRSAVTALALLLSSRHQ